MVAGQIYLRPGEIHLIHSHIPGQVDQNRPGPPGAGDVEGLPEDLGDLLGAPEQIIMLGYGQSDAGYVCFLEGILSYEPGVHLPGDGHHGNRVHVGIGYSRYQVGCPRSGGGDAYADLARGPGVSVRHMSRALLMAHQDMSDVGLVYGIIKRQQNPAGKAEYHINAFSLQALQHRLSPGHLFRSLSACIMLFLRAPVG